MAKGVIQGKREIRAIRDCHFYVMYVQKDTYIYTQYH